jgi:hypothetical protein
VQHPVALCAASCELVTGGAAGLSSLSKLLSPISSAATASASAPCARAQARRSAGEKQQQCCQHCSAVRQPQRCCWQGKGRESRLMVGAGSGIPPATARYEPSAVTAIKCRQAGSRRMFRLFKPIERRWQMEPMARPSSFADTNAPRGASQTRQIVADLPAPRFPLSHVVSGWPVRGLGPLAVGRRVGDADGPKSESTVIVASL